MDKILIDSIKKYFTTLEYVGSINSKEQSKLFVLLFLEDYIKSLDKVDERVYDIFNCLYKNSCVINKRLDCVTININNNGFTYTFEFNLS